MDPSEFRIIKDRCRELAGQRELLENQLREAIDKQQELDVEYENAEEFRNIAQVVGERTMNNLSYHISNIVTLALRAIPFPDNPEFLAEFAMGRNQVECYLWFITNGEMSKPIDSSGGGVLDVTSFALRLTYWSLKKNRPTFALDEPFKYVSVDLQEKCAEMIKMLSDKMGVQIIMVSHLPNINITADKEYIVTKQGMMSVVKEVK